MGVATEEMQHQIVLAIQMGEGAVSGTTGQAVGFDGDGAPVAVEPKTLLPGGTEGQYLGWDGEGELAVFDPPVGVPEGTEGQTILYDAEGNPVATTIILVPAPDAEGTFTLQSVDGVLSWVAVE